MVFGEFVAMPLEEVPLERRRLLYYDDEGFDRAGNEIELFAACSRRSRATRLVSMILGEDEDDTRCGWRTCTPKLSSALLL